MSRYKCIHAFTDLQDLNHVYNPGDKFPWDNKRISVDRIIELSTSRNKLGRPLIEKIDDKADAEPNDVEAPKAAKVKKTEQPKVEATEEPKVETTEEPKAKTQTKSRSKKKKEDTE